MAETKPKQEEPKFAGYAYLTNAKGSYGSAGILVRAGEVTPVNEAQKKYLERDDVPVKVAKTEVEAQKAVKAILAPPKKKES